MIEVYRRKPEPPDWPRPSAVIARSVDSLTGALATFGCADRAYVEYFIMGTEPTRTCRDYVIPGLLQQPFRRPPAGVDTIGSVPLRSPPAGVDTIGRAPFRRPD
jgi:penicillin-binding protein 1A